MVNPPPPPLLPAPPPASPPPPPSPLTPPLPASSCPTHRVPSRPKSCRSIALYAI